MTREEFTGVTFNDLDPPGTLISRSSEWVFRRQQHRNRAKYTTQSAYCIKQETTGEIIVYARNMESG